MTGTHVDDKICLQQVCGLGERLSLVVQLLGWFWMHHKDAVECVGPHMCLCGMTETMNGRIRKFVRHEAKLKEMVQRKQ